MTAHNADDIIAARDAIHDKIGGDEWGFFAECAEYALDAVSRQIAARALTDAADALSEPWNNPHIGVAAWLRARAADLRETP